MRTAIKTTMAGENPVVQFTAQVPEPAGEILNPDALALLVKLQQP